MNTKINVTNLTKKECGSAKVTENKQENKPKSFFEKLFGNSNKKTNNDEKNNNIKSNKFNVSGILKNKQTKAVIVVLIFGLVALFILNSSLDTKFLTSSTESKNNTTGYMSSLEYCEKLENKLVEVLSKISGVGEVKVMVTVENSPILNIANNTDERTNTTTNGNSTTTNSTFVTEPILVKTSNSSTPLVVSESSPKITGVVVVASGAKDVRIRLNLLEAIEALFDVSSNNIQIYY